LRQALELVQDATGSYERNVVFFFTDGSAGYPRAALADWSRSPAILPRTELRAVAYGDLDTLVLESMADEFKRMAAGASFSEVGNGSELSRAFSDTLTSLQSRASGTTTTGGWQCTTVTCGPREKLLPSGSCERCPAFESPVGPDNYHCAQPKCPSNAVLEGTGLCRPCPALTEAIGGKCEPITCPVGKRLRSDGVCEDCPTHSFPSADGRYCEKEDCDYRREWLRESGRCAPCGDFKAPAPDGRSCVRPTCRGGQRVTKSGGCEACGPTATVSPDGQSCQQIVLAAGQIVRDGAAYTCGDHSRPNGPETACITDTCRPREKLQLNGTCAECGAW